MNLCETVYIEGLDGCGKQTQAEMLKEKISSITKQVDLYSFPNYSGTCGRIIKDYLDQSFGDPTTIHPNLIAPLFAIDRVETVDKNNNIKIFDRYIASNMAYQGAKISDKDRRFKFYEDILKIENALGNHQIHLTFYLKSDPEITQNQAKTRGKLDGHESDLAYLKRVSKAYDEVMFMYFPHSVIECIDKEGKLRTKEDISNEIFTKYIQSRGTRNV